jgi:DNA-binding CsgD family transcriptional regulator
MTREEGDYAVARHWFEQALPMFREIGSPINVAITLSNLGHVLRHLGENVRADHSFIEALGLARDLNSKVLIPLVLAGLAGHVSAQGSEAGEAQAEDAVRAARLLSAATALLEDSGGFLEPVDRADYDAYVAATRARLGEQAFASEWAEGQVLTMDQAIAYALQVGPEPAKALPGDSPLDSAAKTAPAASGAEAGLQQLTRRELEVLRLVAEGLTTPQVAKRLVLSVRTVENHLRSIYGKLDVSTRAAATRIAVEHGLLND